MAKLSKKPPAPLEMASFVLLHSKDPVVRAQPVLDCEESSVWRLYGSIATEVTSAIWRLPLRSVKTIPGSLGVGTSKEVSMDESALSGGSDACVSMPALPSAA